MHLDWRKVFSKYVSMTKRYSKQML